MSIADVETSCLKRLLRDVATVNSETAGQFKIDRYYISEALDSLNDRAGVTRDKMAELEFFLAQFVNCMRHLVTAAARQARSLAPGARPTRWNQLR